MAEYQFTDPVMGGGAITRTEDGACIPADPANRDYAEYLRWVDDGGVTDPYEPPAPAAPEAKKPTLFHHIAFNHENRIRALEGQPWLTMEGFMAKLPQE